MMTNKNDKEVFLWQDELIVPLLTGIKVAEGTAEYASFSVEPSLIPSKDYNASGTPIFSPVYPSDEIKCSCCQLQLESRDLLIKHYSEDWHKINIKRTIEGLQPIPFNSNDILPEADNGDSDSDSTSEFEDEADISEEEQEQYRRTPRIYFKNVDGIIFSIYKTILLPPKKNANSEAELISKAQYCYKKLYWVIILIAGGNFAAAVFKGPIAVLHKTFHSYTTRAKQGGSQSSYDNKKGRQATSAGASLRRYNEKAFNQHVQEILREWKDHLENCDIIYHRSPLKYSHILFGGQTSILKKLDHRLRTIPFPTRRPTFNETKKVQHELSKVVLYDLNEFKLESEKNKKSNFRNKPVFKKTIKENVNAIKKEILDVENSDDSDSVEEELICELTEISFSGLEEYGYVETVHSDDGNEKNDRDKTSEVKNLVYDACVKDNFLLLETLANFSAQGFLDNDEIVPTSVREFLLNNSGKIDVLKLLFGPHEKTLLHVATENCKNNMIWWLMEHGCDPTEVDLKNRLPYNVAVNKEVRNQFRRFRAEYPDKFDYKKAHIPEALTKEEDAQRQKKQKEKKLANKKAKKLKDNEIMKVGSEKLKEKKEKQRYINLSEREKRALAAEKRILISNQNIPLVRQFCNFCNTDMTGNVPFSFNNLNFCSTSCVQKQRKANK